MVKTPMRQTKARKRGDVTRACRQRGASVDSPGACRHLGESPAGRPFKTTQEGASGRSCKAKSSARGLPRQLGGLPCRKRKEKTGGVEPVTQPARRSQNRIPDLHGQPCGRSFREVRPADKPLPTQRAFPDNSGRASAGWRYSGGKRGSSVLRQTGWYFVRGCFVFFGSWKVE